MKNRNFQHGWKRFKTFYTPSYPGDVFSAARIANKVHLQWQQLIVSSNGKWRWTAHLHTYMYTNTKATQTHACLHKHLSLLPLSLSSCPMWSVASTAGPLTVVMVWNIPVTPAGLTSPLCQHAGFKAPCYPYSCLPQVLLTDRGCWKKEAEKQTQASLHLPDGEWLTEANRSLWGCIFSASLALAGFAVSCVTNCLATTPGVIVVTHRWIGCAQTLAK